MTSYDLIRGDLIGDDLIRPFGPPSPKGEG